MNYNYDYVPPENPSEANFPGGVRVLWGRARFGPGQRVGVEPIAVRIEMPPGHGDAPKDWFYLGQMSDNKMRRDLEGGCIPEHIWVECYRQAWLREKHRPCSRCGEGK